jgi:hypothetical protein
MGLIFNYWKLKYTNKKETIDLKRGPPFSQNKSEAEIRFFELTMGVASLPDPSLPCTLIIMKQFVRRRVVSEKMYLVAAPRGECAAG